MIYYDGNKISINDLKQENYLIKNENNSLKIRLKAMQETIESLRDKYCKLQATIDAFKLNNQQATTTTYDDNNGDSINTADMNLIENYIKQIEELRY